MTDQTISHETRAVSGFSGFQFKGVGKIELTQGDHEELVIEAPVEVRERIRTEVRNGVLVVSYDSDWRDWTGLRMLGGEKIIFRLMMREIKSLGISGVGNLDTAEIKSDQLSLSLSGPGLMTFGSLNTPLLNISLSGVGSIDVAGKADEINLVISGAGNVKASRLETEKALIKLSGVGNATIWAKTSLDVSISGAGVIEYYGTPQISEHNSGLGVLKYLGKR